MGSDQNRIKLLNEISNDQNDANMIYDKLHKYFTEDMSWNMEQWIGNGGGPVVIFLDTLEFYHNAMNNGSKVTDKWLEYIIKNVPYVLWTFFGRDGNSTGNTKMWNNLGLDNYESRIEKFSYQDVWEYANKYNIVDEQIVNTLFEFSDGIPFILELLVKMYIDQGYDFVKADPDLYGKYGGDIVHRYINYIQKKDNYAYKVLMTLSLMPDGWTDEMMDTIGGSLKYYNKSTYDVILKDSLVSKDENGVYHIQRTLRECIVQDLMRSKNMVKKPGHTEEDEKALEIYNNVTKVLKDYYIDITDFDDSSLSLSRIMTLLEFCSDDEKVSLFMNKLYPLLSSSFLQQENNALPVVDALRYLQGENRAEGLFDEHMLNLEYLALDLMGNYKDALDKAEKCYNHCLDVFGEDHPSTLASLSNLALCLYYLGRYEDALEYNRKCYEKRASILGEDHPSTLTSLKDLVLCLFDMGRYEDALEYNRKFYEKTASILGEDHPDTLASLNNLAFCLSKMGRYEDALEYNRKVYEKTASILEEDHPYTLASLNNLVRCLCHMGRYEEALEYNRKVYEKTASILGENHPDKLTILNNLALCLYGIGRYSEAQEYSRKCYEQSVHIFGEKDSFTVGVWEFYQHILRKLEEESTETGSEL